ncbi:zinc-binding alcohol dehydrogenase family protein [Halioxenophilus sp. WMMB6]|uniref:zinc-binding alcohol dehydrogenase family protein n=1 Tax=Halioxenophilus sp. WMMB6 TaxID=3073815 RepID=UPI00295EBF58|nr:zinc-binding alcohol dehydrogenase family protein [Halioxenophilus sp. WMMB6]
MKAIAYHQPSPTLQPDSLVDIDLPAPTPGARDLLVAVAAVSVNPVDTKIRRTATPAPGEVKVLGYDAVGEVQAVGSEVTLFQPGDWVFYAGVINRPGSNAELQCVDERIVGRAPASLSAAEAAAIPLTALTAWELLFDRLAIARQPSGRPQSLLVVGGAGGVGSMLIQLARALTDVTVIATASRPETQAWVKELGAHQVINHQQSLSQQLAELGIGSVDMVAGLTHSAQHLPEIVACLKPQGRFGMIDDPSGLDLGLLKPKSLSLHWEYMFTRALFNTDDMIAQHQALSEISQLVDAGRLRTTLSANFGTINAANLLKAHAAVESETTKGKIVLAGF